MRAKLAIVAIVLVIAGCHRKAEPTHRSGPIPLNQLSEFDDEVFPLANGDAYLLNVLDQQLFFLSKGTATRVVGARLEAVEASIYPLADGTAYLVSGLEGHLRLYHLNGATAILVKEGRLLADIRRPADSTGFAWAEAQAALRRLRKERHINEAPPEPEIDEQQ